MVWSPETMATSKTALIDHILHNFKAFQITTMLCSPETIASSKTILSVAATLTASAVLFRNIAYDLVPEPVQGYFHSRLHKLTTCLSSQLTVVIDESDGLTPNQMFDAANVYLGAKLSPLSQRIKVHKPEKEKELAVTIDRY